MQLIVNILGLSTPLILLPGDESAAYAVMLLSAADAISCVSLVIIVFFGTCFSNEMVMASLCEPNKKHHRCFVA